MNKKLRNILIIIGVVLCIIGAIFGSLYLTYKNHINISENYKDNFEYSFTNNSNSNGTDKYNIKDFISYDSKTNSNILYIDLPKELLYSKYIDMKDINNLYMDKYGIKFNRIGIFSDEENKKQINVYGDCTYTKYNIDFYLTTQLQYEFSKDLINISFIDMTIGDGTIPKKLYKSFVPYKENEIIESISINKFEELKDFTINSSNIKKMSIKKDEIALELDFIQTLKDNLKGSIYYDVIEKYIDELAPEILEILIGDDPETHINSLLNTIFTKVLFSK